MRLINVDRPSPVHLMNYMKQGQQYKNRDIRYRMHIKTYTSLCPVSSSRLLDPRASGPGNLTTTQDFGLLGPAPNLAYYLGVLVISSETNMYYERNRASGYTIFKVFVPFSVSGKRTQIRCPEVQRLSATYSCP